MSASPSELQDEVSKGQRFFVAVTVGTSHAKPGERVFKSYSAGRKEAEDKNKERTLNIARRRPAGPVFAVFVLYIRRKKDCYKSGSKWHLLRRTRVHTMTADDVIAFAMEDKMMRAGGFDE